MNKLTCETNSQAQDFRESAAKKTAQLELAAVATPLEPWQLDIVGGGEMIVCW